MYITKRWMKKRVVIYILYKGTVIYTFWYSKKIY